MEKPVYQWDKSQNLVLYYEYAFMPKGLLGRLIVRLHRYIKDIQAMAWRNGCVFTYENTDAQVIETYGHKKIEIRVRGEHCVRLSSIIIREIDELNAGFERIQVDKSIPCNCSKCRQQEEPEFYKYERLMNRLGKGRSTVECDSSFEDVSIRQILNGVFDEQAAKEPTVQELIRKGKILDALSVFEQRYPEEAILLLQHYNEGARLYYLNLCTEEEWSVVQSRISQGMLAISKQEATASQRTTQKEIEIVLSKLDDIKVQLNRQDAALDRIIALSDIHQQELLDLLVRLEANPLSEAQTDQLLAAIQRGMKDFETKAPQAQDIIEKWQTAQQQLKLAADSKIKLKWSVPFLFMRLEKEFAWNGQDWFRAIREDIQRGREGKWTEMFVDSR